jgi:hypothetical protein
MAGGTIVTANVLLLWDHDGGLALTTSPATPSTSTADPMNRPIIGTSTYRPADPAWARLPSKGVDLVAASDRDRVGDHSAQLAIEQGDFVGEDVFVGNRIGVGEQEDSALAGQSLGDLPVPQPQRLVVLEGVEVVHIESAVVW